MMAQEAALAFMGDVTVNTFSSLNRHGLPELERMLDLWFGRIQPESDEEAEA